MKKIVLFVLSSFVILLVVGCNGVSTGELTTSDPTVTTEEVTTEAPTLDVTTEDPTSGLTDTYPVISGVEDITIEKNSNFVPLEGVTAWDEEDGDITDDIQYSGNVNPMAEGDYTATYTVVDSDGNVTTENRTVTVVFVDSQGPLLVGVGAITIYVGDQFNPLEGVSASDTVDGSVPVTFTGDLDVWMPGDYNLEYTAEDESGNVTTKSRIVTVSFGDFNFGDSSDYTLLDFTPDGNKFYSPAITGGVINSTIADFTYIKVTISINVDADCEFEINLGQIVGSFKEVDLVAGDNELTVYYRIDEPITDAVFDIETFGGTISTLDFSVSFAEVRDMVAPVLNVTKDEIAYVVDYSMEGLEALLLEGVTAVDDIDGNVTSDIELNYGDLDITTPGEYEVTYSVTDESGNTSQETINVVIGNLVDSGFISDPTFQNQGDAQWTAKETGGGDVDLTYDPVEGVMNIKVINVGTYTSAAGAYLKADSLDLEVDQWYMFSVTIKTDIDRSMGIRMGLATDQAHGWVDDFNSKGEVRIDINGQYQTFNFYFKLDSLYSSAGWNEFFIELNLGALNYSQTGTGGTTSFKDVTIYKVTTAYEPPTYEENVGADLPIKFTVGDSQKDWADYVTFYDMSKEVLTPSVDASNVDMNTPGTYSITLTATDSRGNSTDYTLAIQVLAAENADTEGPVVTLVEGVPTSIDQFTNIQVQLHELVVATDAVDGDIEILPSMVDDGGFDFNVAGDYTITVSVYDLSGNVTDFEITVTVVDKEAPTINISDISLNVDDVFDINDILEVTDNFDGIIPNANVTITGLDAFIADGMVTTEGTFTVTFEVSDAGNNMAQKTITVEVFNFDWDESTRTDLLNNQNEGPTHSTMTYDDINAEYVISNIDVNVDPWDHARLVYYFDQLETGKTYKFEFTVKADVATDLYFRIGSTLMADPWLDNFEGGLKTISISDEYVTYQMIFKVTKDMPLGTAKFQFSYGYLASDATNNIYISQFDMIQMQEEGQQQEVTYTEIEDLLGTQDEGPTHSTMTYDDINDEYVISGIDPNTESWDHARLVYYFDQLEAGKTYRILISIKADQATDLYFRIGSTLMADPWVDNFEGGLKTISIGTEYAEYELVFTVDKDMPLGNAKFQLMYGYLASDATNTMYMNHFALEEVVPAKEVTYTEVADLLNNQDEGPTHSTMTYDDVNDEYVISAIDVNVDPWDHARLAYYFDQLEAGKTYRILISIKADQATDLYLRIGSTLMVDPWIDNFEGGLETISIGTEYAEYELVFTVDKDMPLGTAKFQFMYGYLASDATNTMYINHFALEEVVPVENVTYTEVMDLLGAQDEGPTHSDVTVNGENVYEITNIDPNTESWDHARWVYYFDQLEMGETYRFLITVKATENTDIYFRIGSTLMADPWVDNFEGGLKTISVETYYETFEVVFTVDKDMPLGTAKFQFMYGYLANDANITIYISDFALEKQEIQSEEPENNAPVVTISDSNLALISSIALEEGISIESYMTELLAMIEINDVEDGVIAATESMITLGSLDLANPSMGTYTLQIATTDSNGLASNTYELELSVVSIFKDFNDFYDDAALKAWDGLYGFRTSGGGWLASSGTLVVDEEQNAAAVTLGGGTNGIRINVTKSELVALGAEYLGIYVKFEGTLADSSVFQSFTYDASYQQITSYGDISYVEGGTYIFVKVSELKEAQVSVSLMINAGSGSTGTLTIEKIVIK